MHPVSFQIDHNVARLCLNRPESRNALGMDTLRALLDALERAEGDHEAGSILLESTGPLFSVGLKLSESLISSTAEELRLVHQVLSFTEHSTKPLVAAVQGGALGAGAALAASAHVALAAQGASFGFTEIRAGLWPYLGWPAIQSALGSRRALELTLTGRVFSSADALAWGLVHEVTQPSELEDRAFSTASLLAAAPPETVRKALAWLREPSDPTLAAHLNLASAEAREGLDALVEKRRPRWRGV